MCLDRAASDKGRKKEAIIMRGLLFRYRNRGRRVLDDVQGFGTLLGSGTRLVGELEGTDSCIVNGAVEGNCRLDAVLLLNEGARWTGSLNVRSAVVAGTIEGDITVQEKLELTPTARVFGAVSGAQVAMAAGAVHEGAMHVVSPSGVVHFEEKRVSGRRRPGPG
ncbi:MAG TPA: polymer-forming cytoskeletal protein [Gammaproteobacteria bacterium]|nr:polymer-forming cytoskeletal protein [Gammaproteobacteria bacterium]